ncbi:MAG: hypothetical protein K2Q22_05485, partial [Cytophagales bacterium]|nr:hypothetical protein [Cytophagales bacterium]
FNKLIYNRKKDLEPIIESLGKLLYYLNDNTYEHFEKYEKNKQIIFVVNFESAKKIIPLTNNLIKKIDFEIFENCLDLKLNTLIKFLIILDSYNKKNLSEVLASKIIQKFHTSDGEGDFQLDNFHLVEKIFNIDSLQILQNTIIKNFHKIFYSDIYEEENCTNNFLLILSFYLRESKRTNFLSEVLMQFICENFLKLDQDLYDFENFINLYHNLTLHNYYSEKFFDDNFIFEMREVDLIGFIALIISFGRQRLGHRAFFWQKWLGK